MYTISIRNMTQVNSAEIIIYSDEAVDPAYKAEVADLKMEEGSAGSLTLKVPVGNAGYDYFEELSTQVIVRKDTVTNNPDKVYWIGRLLNMKIDFNNSKELLFEGIFNYLMDTIQLPSKSECNLESWVSFLLNNHNAICTSSGEHYKKVYKGTWDISIDTVSHELYTDYETSQEMINNAIEYDELHVFFRYVWDSTNNCYNLYLDFKKNYDASGDVPVISFGQNLMDYSRSYEPDELATVIIPRGERYSDEDWDRAISGGNPKEDSNAPEELDHYRTVWSCATTSDHTNHDYRVYTTSTENLNRFGYVSKVMDFDGVRDYNTLLQLAQNYLANQKWIKLTIEISAIDMTLLAPDINIDAISVGRMIHCISAPHGLNYYYPCTAVEENILDVSGSRYTLGTGDVKYLTDAKRENDEKLKELVRKNIERENILTSNILHKPVNEFTSIKDAIDDVERMSQEDILTVKTEAKADVLNMLNIYDSKLNKNNKGYVHFIREYEDYSRTGTITIDQLITRVKKYHEGKSYVTSFLNNLNAALNARRNWQPGDDYYVIYALLGPNDYQTAVVIAKYTTIFSQVGWKGNIASDGLVHGTLSFQNYPGSNNGYFTSTSATKCGAEGGYVGDRLNSSKSAYNFSWATADQYTTTGGYISSYQRTYVVLCPSDPNFNLSDGSVMYCSDDIYGTDGVTIKYAANLLLSGESNPMDHITEIVVSDKLDYMANDANVWRWNYTGLYCLRGGYYANHQEEFIANPEQTGYQDPNDKLRLALTADGNIVADRITVGILNADVVKTGVIRSRPVGTAEPDGNMMIDIPNGNIIAKKGTLIFNDVREVQTVPAGKKVTPLDGFIYISNINAVDDQGTPLLMNVGGEQKNDWRIVSGDSFGVDSGGRAYMREGIIGATGGEFSVVGRNSSFVRCAHYTSDSNYKWTVNFNTDASRPLFSENASEAANFRFRIAHYGSNNTLEFVSKLFSFIFPVGKEAVSFTEEFYPVIPYSQGSSVPYAEGELFPIWYSLNDSATEDYYEQDGHRYTMYNSDGNVITSDGSNPPKYTTYTSTRTQSGGTNAGSVVIGSGYLANGTFGQNRSFYLGGIKRSGTVANNTRDDWRFAVGSKFGVTENGNVYCTDMYARGAYLDRCTVTGNITATSVSHLSLNSHNIWDGESKFTNYRWRINIDATSYGGGMFSSNTDFYVMTQDDPQIVPNKSATFSFKVYLEQVPIDNPSAQPSDKYVDSFTFTYNKNGTPGIAQRISIDTTSWSTPDVGWKAATDGEGNPIIKIGSIEMDTSESSSFVYIGFTQEKDCPTATGQGTEFYTYIEGTFTTANVVGQSRDAVACSCDFIGRDKWLGGPRNFWAKAYVSETIRTVSGNGSSKLYKENIEPLNGRYSELFDKLKPVRYNFRKEIYDDDGKYHTGFIMEDIGESMKQLDISEDNFAAYNPDHENGGGNVRYDELIALAVDEIHSLKHRVSELEKQLYEQGIIVTDD